MNKAKRQPDYGLPFYHKIARQVLNFADRHASSFGMAVHIEIAQNTLEVFCGLDKGSLTDHRYLFLVRSIYSLMRKII